MSEVTHAHVSSLPDDPDYDVSKDEWNAPHTIDIDAADVDVTPAGAISSTNVQAALQELDTEKSGTGHNHDAAYDAVGAASSAVSGHTGDTSDAHDASAISFTPEGTISATDVQAAIEEVASEAGGSSGVDVQDDTTPVATATTINFGDNLDVTDDGGGHITVDATGGSGDPTTASVWEAKGDLLAGTGDNTATRLPVGSDNQILLAQSSQVTGLAWTPLDASLITFDPGESGMVSTGAASAIQEAYSTAANHIADTSAAHAASAISADSTTLVGTGTNVQAVLEELDDGVAAAGLASAHVALTANTPQAVGTAAVGNGTASARDNHVHATGAGTPSTQAIGDAAATGSGPAAAMTDHKHAMPAFGTGPAAVGTQANGASANIARIDHVHATGAGTPSTQAFGDSAATGSGPAAAMTDHKHAMPANPVTGHEAASDPHTGYVKESTAQTVVLAAATFVGAPPANGNYMSIQVPVACTVTAVLGHFKGGTNVVINARKNQASNFMSSNLTVSTANAWSSSAADQNQSLAAATDDIELMIVSTSGAVTEASIMVVGTRVLA